MRARTATAILATVGATAALTVTALSGGASAQTGPDCVEVGNFTSCRYDATGAPEPFTVPDGVLSVHVRAVGAHGGNTNFNVSGTPFNFTGGRGAAIEGVFPTIPATVWWVFVGGDGQAATQTSAGGGGFNGGGDGQWRTNPSAGGGGASDVRTDPDNVETRFIVAAGGGGAGLAGGNGGDAGAAGTTNATGQYLPGQPGTLTAGGIGGNGLIARGEPGTLAAGGAGAAASGLGGGGGGGGGFFGGGGGGAASNYGAGGGGGSSLSLGVTGSTPGVVNEEPSVTITYLTPPEPPTTTTTTEETTTPETTPPETTTETTPTTPETTTTTPSIPTGPGLFGS